jgi:hypothetical protein
VYETPTVIALLIDRSFGNQVCVGHKFLVICTEPQQVYLLTATLALCRHGRFFSMFGPTSVSICEDPLNQVSLDMTYNIPRHTILVITTWTADPL